MVYTDKNFKTKKAFKEAVAAGKEVYLYQPGPFPMSMSWRPGQTQSVEGPHYPEPHKWYATATLNEDGVVVKVK
jgi:hypothetical protein